MFRSIWPALSVAQQVGLQASAIRNYERIGLLPLARERAGRDDTTPQLLYRLAIIRRARQLGFTLDEIRELFFGFCNVSHASERWQTLSRKKLAELDGLMDGIETVRRLLKKMMQNCRCDTLEQCGKEIFRSGCADVAVKSLLLKPRRSL